MTEYKRIFQTTAPHDEVMSHAVFGTTIRRTKNGPDGEYAIVAGPHERRAVDKVVALFDTAAS